MQTESRRNDIEESPRACTVLLPVLIRNILVGISMLKSGWFSSAALLFAVSLFLLAAPPPTQKWPWRAESEATDSPYIQRGNEIQNEFKSYSDALADYYHRLAAALRSELPELVADLRVPDTKRSGYQILPQVTPDDLTETPAPGQSGYSWPWTERLIRRARHRLAHFDMQLRRTQSLDSAPRRAALEKLARDYDGLRQDLANLEAHVQYNRFWQSVIAADRASYDREMLLYRDVLAREQVRDELRYFNSAFANAPAALQPAFGVLSLANRRDSLEKREALLCKRIDSALGQITTPAFISLERRAHEWIFRVPLYTDIKDQDFIAAAKRMIEAVWRFADNGNTYRVEIQIPYLPTELLHADSEVAAPGEKLDVKEHLRNFPATAAVLTTGALTTHVENNAIVLGPDSISPRVLAHEFGHVLGFRDRYIRGYRDLGKDGFEVLEAIADPRDIMGAPATGSVLSTHFDALIQAMARAQE
jgi:hypothetical protein